MKNIVFLFYLFSQISYGVVCFDELGRCDPNSLSQAKSVIDILHRTLVENYKDQRIPKGTAEIRLNEQLNSYASLVNDYNKCLGSIPSDHICGEDGYDQLSNLWDKLSRMPSSTNEEILKKNKVVHQYNFLSDKYKNCPRKFVPCQLNLQLIVNENKYIYEKLISGQLRKRQKCEAVMPDKRFRLVFDKKTGKQIYNIINGLVKLKENYSCKIDGASKRSERRIQPLKNKIAIFDDVEGVKFPTMIEYFFEEELNISHEAEHSTFRWGSKQESPFLKIDRSSGLIIKNNIFGESLHNEEVCKTSSAKEGTAPELDNLKNLKFIRKTF